MGDDDVDAGDRIEIDLTRDEETNWLNRAREGESHRVATGLGHVDGADDHGAWVIVWFAAAAAILFVAGLIAVLFSLEVLLVIYTMLCLVWVYLLMEVE